MTDQLTYSGALIVVTCWCGIRHGVPQELRYQQLREFNDGKKVSGIFCPLGHAHVPGGTSEHEKVSRQLVAERARLDQVRAELASEKDARRSAERSAIAERAAKTRLKNRIARGVCPCCKRTFANVARHISGKHPEYKQ